MSGRRRLWKHLGWLAGLGMLAGFGLAETTNVAGSTLAPGDPGPDFKLPGSDGKTYSLADYRGKQAVVLAWFPKAFTSG
jgi:peroxiredoxin Q/BCP